MPLQIEQVEALRAVDSDAALKLAKKEWLKAKNTKPLDDDSIKLLAIIGSLLHDIGDDREALGYLSRFHEEFCTKPIRTENSIVLDWADLLYVGVGNAVRTELNLKHKDAEDLDEAVQIEWNK